MTRLRIMRDRAADLVRQVAGPHVLDCVPGSQRTVDEKRQKAARRPVPSLCDQLVVVPLLSLSSLEPAKFGSAIAYLDLEPRSLYILANTTDIDQSLLCLCHWQRE